MTLRRFVELAQLSIVRDAVLVGAVGQVHLTVLGLHRLAARQCDVHHAFVRLETLDLAPLEGRVLARPDPDLGATLHSETLSPSWPRGPGEFLVAACNDARVTTRLSTWQLLPEKTSGHSAVSHYHKRTLNVVKLVRYSVGCCSSRPIIGMNEHCGRPSHGGARWWSTLGAHGWPSGARVSRHPTAGSHHSYGVDSTTRRFRAYVPQYLSKGSLHRAHHRLCCSSRLSAAPQLLEPEKWYFSRI